MSQSFCGKVVIVTGSSSGIGEAISTKLAHQGASVVICGRDEQRTKAARTKCISASNGHDERFVIFLGDLNVKDNRERLVAETVAKFSKVDILIANSGIMTTWTISEDTEETYDQVMNINLKSVYFLIQAAVPYLERTKGNILCVSSVLSTFAMPNRTVYQMSKAAMDQMVRSLALYLGPKGIRVNALNPGVVETRLYRDVPNNDDSVRFKVASSKTPLEGRISTDVEQADVAVFLAGNGAKFVSGECVKVDGAFNLGK